MGSIFRCVKNFCHRLFLILPPPLFFFIIASSDSFSLSACAFVCVKRICLVLCIYFFLFGEIKIQAETENQEGYQENPVARDSRFGLVFLEHKKTSLEPDLSQEAELRRGGCFPGAAKDLPYTCS